MKEICVELCKLLDWAVWEDATTDRWSFIWDGGVNAAGEGGTHWEHRDKFADMDWLLAVVVPEMNKRGFTFVHRREFDTAETTILFINFNKSFTSGQKISDIEVQRSNIPSRLCYVLVQAAVNGLKELQCGNCKGCGDEND